MKAARIQSRNKELGQERKGEGEPGSGRYAWRIVGFSQSRDGKANLKVEVMPREKTGLSEAARMATTEKGYKGSKQELKRASQEQEE